MAAVLKIDFYTVTMPPNSPPFEKLIIDDSQTPNDESRTLDLSGYPVRLQEAASISDYVDGEMLRIKMDDLPPKAKRSGKVRNLGLDDDEGIGGETAFLYHPRTKVLALQRNKSGVTPRMLTEYFHDKGGLNPPIELRPVLQSDALKRLAKMKETRKLIVHFAGVTNPRFFLGGDEGVGAFINAMGHFHAPSATFEFSMGHKPGSLALGNIRSFARSIIGMDDRGAGEVDKIEVSGILDDDTRDVFDLLMYRMVEVVSAKENKNRRSTYKKRRPGVRRAWNKRKAELLEMFGE